MPSSVSGKVANGFLRSGKAPDYPAAWLAIGSAAVRGSSGEGDLGEGDLCLPDPGVGGDGQAAVGRQGAGRRVRAGLNHRAVRA